MSEKKIELTKSEQIGDTREHIADLVNASVSVLKEENKNALLKLLETHHESDIAEMIALLNGGQREQFFALIGEDLAPSVLAELDDHTQAWIAERLDPEFLAAALQELETDDAVFVLGELDDHEQKEILDLFPEGERIVLQRSLDYPDESAGRLMQSDVVAVPPFWTVGQVIDYLRVTEDLPDDFLEIFVVDPTHTPLGMVKLNKVMRSGRPTLMQEILDDNFTPISAELDREDMARMFERYNLVSAPVVDEDNRLVGVITADDVFEVITEEAEEDILRLGGVGDETVGDDMFRAMRGRFSWLLVNLLTAILASIVIGIFDGTIEQMVALAILMPIVASMGGNAATQTLTITVRALATRELLAINTLRVIGREIGIGLLNGILFAILLGITGWLWFGSEMLGIVLAMAMIVNMFVAGLAGIVVPIWLNKVGVDPAIASGVFVTTITDIVGFFAFLGFATIFLI